MKGELRRYIALTLALGMCFSLLSANAWATADVPVPDMSIQSAAAGVEKEAPEEKKEEAPAEAEAPNEKKEEAPKAGKKARSAKKSLLKTQGSESGYEDNNGN